MNHHQIIKNIHQIFLFFMDKNLFYHHKIYFCMPFKYLKATFYDFLPKKSYI